MISIQFNKNTQILINTKNMLTFNILYDVKQENIRLQLENILKSEKIEMVDSKITNFLILSIKKQNTYNRKRKMQSKIIDEFKTEGLQNFNQYLKINPIAIQIVESEIQNKLLFYSKNYKYRFIANSLLFSSSIQKDTNVIFIVTNGLNDAKEILINRKLFQGIAVIYISKIDGWGNIKQRLHWTNVVFADSEYPIAAKHFAFGFETTDLHILLNFEYSLLDDQGNLIEFQKNEDKIPTLKFTIQVVN